MWYQEGGHRLSLYNPTYFVYVDVLSDNAYWSKEPSLFSLGRQVKVDHKVSEICGWYELWDRGKGVGSVFDNLGLSMHRHSPRWRNYENIYGGISIRLRLPTPPPWHSIWQEDRSQFYYIDLKSLYQDVTSRIAYDLGQSRQTGAWWRSWSAESELLRNGCEIISISDEVAGKRVEDWLSCKDLC